VVAAAVSGFTLPSEMRDLLEDLPLALVGVDAGGRIVFANREAETLLGYDRGEVLGQPVEILVPEALRGRHQLARAAYQRAPATRRMGASRELSARRRDGSEFPVAVSLNAPRCADGALVLAGIVDLTTQKELQAHLHDQYALMERRVLERTAELQQRTRQTEELLQSLKQARSELERLSRHDPLTGLLNRREFDERATRELRRASRRQSPTCVAMLDLDHFKSVNDRFGHALGDRVLRRVAAILQTEVRRDDVVARYGGEEFIILLPETALDESTAVIERVRSAVASEPWNEIRAGLALTLSAGLAELARSETLASLIDRADQLLYRAKRGGRNRVEH
jgi:diguanylate cyclase (GGDEF)-like protein/PAS domain S-box-containing protein